MLPGIRRKNCRIHKVFPTAAAAKRGQEKQLTMAMVWMAMKIRQPVEILDISQDLTRRSSATAIGAAAGLE
jgi:hypothetical protein